jgi:hypothetical protein
MIQWRTSGHGALALQVVSALTLETKAHKVEVAP